MAHELGILIILLSAVCIPIFTLSIVLDVWTYLSARKHGMEKYLPGVIIEVEEWRNGFPRP